MSLAMILLILLLCAFLFGGVGATRDWGYWGWSPVGLIILVVLVLVLTGHLG